MASPAEIQQWRASLNQLARETIQIGEDIAQIQKRIDCASTNRTELWEKIDQALDEPIREE